MERIVHSFRHALRCALLVSAGAVAAVHSPPGAADERPRAEPAADVSPCSPALEQMLPGDYNFCMGAAAMRKGDTSGALSRMREAAAWGDKTAQKVLGVAYFNGDGTVQDRALGLAWLRLSTERMQPENVGLFNSALEQVTPEQKARADALYKQMRARYADDVAAVRADRLFRRKLRELASNPVYGSGKCIRGVNSLGFADPRNPDSIKPCSLLSEQRVLNGLQARYDIYFQDWSGRVRTGAVEDIGPAK